jgi:hypothetical protein
LLVSDRVWPRRVGGLACWTFKCLTSPALAFADRTISSSAACSDRDRLGSDSGIIKTTGPGAGSFVTVVRIVGGEGEFAGATGGIVAPGRLDFTTGNTVGTYWGAVCTGRR